MSERYLITGAQLGMLQSFCKNEQTDKHKELIDEIIDVQFLGNSKVDVKIDTEVISKITFKK